MVLWECGVAGSNYLLYILHVCGKTRTNVLLFIEEGLISIQEMICDGLNQINEVLYTFDIIKWSPSMPPDWHVILPNTRLP